ncbi:ABC transporter substrate-binding protein [Kallotenue papyrolyticum]|uniref:ABC transporter substrate-binding protein n=1 Tax=Kallotenue papyrolyticum TaxID=1325125 RepID=UPI0004B78A54|nr:sugar ABC transporter substrate-binding protein [Kallotenue papyrolyticum]
MTHPRVRVLTLLLALLLPLLAACGGGGQTSASPSPAAEASPAPAASPEASPEALPEASPEVSPAAQASPQTSPAAVASPEATPAAGGALQQIDWSKIQVEDGATLRVTSWGDPSEQEINQQSFERFKKIFPNVTIQYEPVPQDYQTRVKADFAAGTNADVMYIDAALMTALGLNGQLLDLRPYMEQVGVSLDDYLGELAQIFVDGDKVYGLPKDQGALVLFVRNDLAEKAGIDPQSIKTWDDWKNAAQKMTADGNFGQCLSAEWQRVGALWEQTGVEYVQDGKINLTDPKIVAATQFWVDFYRNKTGTLPAEVGAQWCGQAFGQGKTAMAMEGGWMLPYLAKDFPEVEFTAIQIPTPADGQPGSLVYTNAWGAAANTKYPNAAAALALYLTSAENQKPIMETGFALPTVKALLDDPYFDQNPNAKVVAEAAGYAQPANLAFGDPTVYDDVINAINTQGIEPIFLGQADVQQALQQAQDAAQSVLDSAQ